MIHGLDTGFLVAAEVTEHPLHVAARAKLASLITANNDQVAIAPQVLTEYLHIVTDGRRFVTPFDMSSALNTIERIWIARETVRVYPSDSANRLFLQWLRQHSLGRKRLLDTLLAATYWEAGISSILTTNSADFAVVGHFQCITP